MLQGRYRWISDAFQWLLGISLGLWTLTWYSSVGWGPHAVRSAADNSLHPKDITQPRLDLSRSANSYVDLHSLLCRLREKFKCFSFKQCICSSQERQPVWLHVSGSHQLFAAKHACLETLPEANILLCSSGLWADLGAKRLTCAQPFCWLVEIWVQGPVGL